MKVRPSQQVSEAPEEGSFRSRHRKDKRRQNLTIWLGASYGGLLVFLTTNLFDNPFLPCWLKPLEITLIVFGGAATGMARVGYEWEATQIERRVEDGEIMLEHKAPIKEFKSRRKKAEAWYDISLLCLVVAGFLVLVAAWWPSL